MIIDRRLFVAGLGSSVALSGCASLSSRTSARPQIALESLVRQMKHDVGSYIFEHQDDPPLAVNSRQPCAGQVSFQIQKVKLSVTASAERSASVSGGLTVPINLVTLGASASRSRTLANTVTVNLTVWPITAGRDAEFEDASLAAQRLTAAPPPSPDFEGTPIRDALNRLRRDLIATADTAPCFNFGEGEQKDNMVRWAFSVSDRANLGGKLSLLVFSIGADASMTNTFANTIEVSFLAVGEGFG